MGLPESDDLVDGVEPGVLREGSRDDLERVRERFYGKLGPAADGCGVVAEPELEFDLDRPAADDELAVLNGVLDDPGRVVDRPLEFVEQELGGAAQEDRDGLRVLAPGDDRQVGVGDLPGRFGMAERRFGEFFGLVDDGAAERFCGELHILFFHVLEGVDAVLREVELHRVGDPLLAEDDVRAGGDDQLGELPEGLALLLGERLHLVGGGDLDLRLHLGLRDLERLGEQGDFSVRDRIRHLLEYALLVDDDAPDQFGVVHRVADLLLDLDVVLVHGVGTLAGLGRDLLHRVHHDAGDLVFDRLDGLPGHGGSGELDEVLPVVGTDGDGQFLEDLKSLLHAELVAVCDDGRVHLLGEQCLRLFHKGPDEHGRGRGAVADLVVLGLRNLNDQLAAGVLHGHLVQDGCPVVRDHHVTAGADQHLVHSPGTERCPNGGRNCFCSHDIRALRLESARALNIVP